MKKNYILFYALFFSLASAIAQNPLVKQWDARFGGTDFDYLDAMQETNDGGYILGGYSLSLIGGDKTQASKGLTDYWVVKIDSLGNKQWDKDFGGTAYEYLYSLKQTNDGGYMLAGASASGVGGDKTQASTGGLDYWIVKLDALGNKQWDKSFGGTSDDILFSMLQTTDKGYMLAGHSASGAGGNKAQASKGGWDYWVVKIDSSGNKQWDKSYGGTSDDNCYSLQQTADGGYVLGGCSYSGIGGDKTQASKGGWDYWIVKIDSLGNKKWDRDFGGTSDDYVNSLQQTIDRGYILGGISFSGVGGDKAQPSKGMADRWIIKIDSIGNKQWDKDFGGAANEEEVFFISQTNDLGYLFSGTSHSTISGDKTENNLGPEQTWVVKTDSAGNKQWDKTLLTTGDDEYGIAIQTKDGCFAIANSSDGAIGGYKTQSDEGDWDYWIIKFRDTSNAGVILPQSNFLATDTVLCANDCISFTNQSTNATSYQWFFTGGSPSSSTMENPHICYLGGGTYDVKLVAFNGGAKDSVTLSNYIHVKAAPTAPNVRQAGTTLYFNNDASYTSYQWYDSTYLIPGATDTFLVVSHDGSYSVHVKNADGCETATGLSVILGITPLSKNNGFFIFPNPLTSSSILQFNKQLKDAEVVIYDMVGKEVLRRKVTGSRMEIESLVSGVYFVSVWEKERRYVQKMVIE